MSKNDIKKYIRIIESSGSGDNQYLNSKEYKEEQLEALVETVTNLLNSAWSQISLGLKSTNTGTREEIMSDIEALVEKCILIKWQDIK